MTHERAEIRAGKAARAAAHDSDLLTRRSSRRGRCDLVGGKLIDRELLNATNIHRCIDERAAAAVLTRVLAHVCACRGERVVFANHANGTGVIARARKRDVRRHVHVRRAQRFAWHRLGDAFSALALIHMAFEFSLERVKAAKKHFRRMPSDGTIGRIAHDVRLRANLVERARLGLKRKHFLK